MSIALNSGPARGASVAVPLVGTPIVQAAPTAADKPPAGTQPAANRFAELLRRNRAEAPKPAPPAPAPSPRGDESHDSAETGDTSSVEAKAASVNAAKARASSAKETSKPVVDRGERQGATSDATPGDDCGSGDDSDRRERAAAPPAAADRLDARAVTAPAIDAVRRLAATSASGNGDAAGSASEDRSAAAPVDATTRHSLGHARGMASVDAASDRHASGTEVAHDTALRVASDGRVPIGGGESSTFDSPSAASAHERRLDALTASLGVGAPPLGVDSAIAASPSAALPLPTPIDAPDFAAALGVRVSLLVQDGVQRAELHLNPAETGPVSIHITVDGTAARVDFGADVAATRAAIERGLPELASALREAGFTLAGGGVSQHAGGRAGDDGGARSSPRFEGGTSPVSAAIATDSRTVVRTVRAGGVDLYA